MIDLECLRAVAHDTSDEVQVAASIDDESTEVTIHFPGGVFRFPSEEFLSWVDSSPLNVEKFLEFASRNPGTRLALDAALKESHLDYGDTKRSATYSSPLTWTGREVRANFGGFGNFGWGVIRDGWDFAHSLLDLDTGAEDLLRMDVDAVAAASMVLTSDKGEPDIYLVTVPGSSRRFAVSDPVLDLIGRSGLSIGVPCARAWSKYVRAGTGVRDADVWLTLMRDGEREVAGVFRSAKASLDRTDSGRPIRRADVVPLSWWDHEVLWRRMAQNIPRIGGHIGDWADLDPYPKLRPEEASADPYDHQGPYRAGLWGPQRRLFYEWMAVRGASDETMEQQWAQVLSLLWNEALISRNRALAEHRLTWDGLVETQALCVYAAQVLHPGSIEEGATHRLAQAVGEALRTRESEEDL